MKYAQQKNTTKENDHMSPKFEIRNWCKNWHTEAKSEQDVRPVQYWRMKANCLTYRMKTKNKKVSLVNRK